MSNRISWERDQRERAKDTGQALFAVAFDGRTADPKSGFMSFMGPLPTDVAHRLFDNAFQEMLKVERAEIAAKNKRAKRKK